jgi:hypothetical protein
MDSNKTIFLIKRNYSRIRNFEKLQNYIEKVSIFLKGGTEG